MIRIDECKESSLSGLYIQMRGTYRELNIVGPEKAKEIAAQNGYDPEGRNDSGYPAIRGEVYTKGFWFFDKRQII